MWSIENSRHERFRLKLYPNAHSVEVVHVEYLDRCPTYRREPDDAPGLDAEVMVPVFSTRVEETSQLTSVGIYP